MAKLYFRYGTVSSAKTLNLLAVVHSYGQQGKKALLLKPQTDTRFGASVVQSRTGLSENADLVLSPSTTHLDYDLSDTRCILVDEVQFFEPCFIELLRSLATTHNIPVICYGLRTDFKTYAFAGSRRLLELADSIEEIKTTCSFCNKKAVFNLKLEDGIPTAKGDQIKLGLEETYLPACPRCYQDKLYPKGQSTYQRTQDHKGDSSTQLPYEEQQESSQIPYEPKSPP